MNKSFLVIIALLVIFVTGCTFVDPNSMSGQNPGALMGVWHGLLSPYTIIVRFFYNIGMYSFPNQGFVYDVGFLLGVLFSLPVGWIATLISLAIIIF